MIYLDNAATTKVSKDVLHAMMPYFDEQYGNAGSTHCMGRVAKNAMEKARVQVAAPINAKPEDIIFTSCATEANSLVFFGLVRQLTKTGNTHIIVSSIEHDSVLSCAEALRNRYGFDISVAEPDQDGIIQAKEVSRLVRDNTGLISVMTVNNELGTQNPIHEIGELCREREILFHTDCVQGYCNVPVDVETENIDFLSVSGHKFHAPKGVGFLYAKRKELLLPLLAGGGQEFDLRAGTENVPYIVAIGKAAEIANSKATERFSYENMIRSFRNEIECVGGTYVNGAPYPGSKIVNIRFDGIDGETLLLLLDSQNICVSAGSACSAHSAKPSHVLKGIGLTDLQAKSSIRVSISDDTTFEELMIAAKEICKSVNILRGK